MKKSDKYIFEEADYIKRAIEDEQAIQMLKDEISDDVKVLFLTHPLFSREGKDRRSSRM